MKSTLMLPTLLVVNSLWITGFGAEAADPASVRRQVHQGRKLFNKATFEGNGRTCLTCHTEKTGALSVEQVRRLDSHDPLFQHDAADVIGGHTFDRVRFNATFLVTIDLPENVRLTGSDARSVVVPRGVPTVFNTPALDPVLMSDGRQPNLQAQALDAYFRHSQITEVPSSDELNDIASFEKTLFSSHSLRQFAAGGAAPELPKAVTASEKRGRLFFTDDNPSNGNPIKGRCVHCHGGPMLNATSPGANAIFGIPVGTRFISAFVSEFELGGGTPIRYVFNQGEDNETVLTSTDLGRALITGDPADANAFKISTLWGFKQTAPYMHNSGALDVDQLLDHYQSYFNFVENVAGVPGFGMSDQDKADIKAYIKRM